MAVITEQSVGKSVESFTTRDNVKERILSGRIQITADGRSFLTLAKDQKRMFIPGFRLNGALRGDLVEARVRQQGRKLVANIARVLERARDQYTGVVRKDNDGLYLQPYDYRVPYPVRFQDASKAALQDGEYVVAQVVKFPSKNSPVVFVALEKRLGRSGSPNIERLVLTHEYNLPGEFSPEVTDEVESIPVAIPVSEILRRRDLRDESIFTIDGTTSKDFDDAVSIQKLANGNFRLGVHIADVSYFVKPGTPLDQEAYRRATSAYFSDGAVLPMLPAKLSDDLCSLVPNQNRLTLSCVMEIDSNGNVLRADVFESVINSRARLTYQQVDEILNDKNSSVRKACADLCTDLDLMKELASTLRQRRHAEGSLDLTTKSIVPVFNKNGDIVSVREEPRLLSSSIIEEFMLSANVAVTRFASDKPFIYRIQPEPKPQSVERIRSFLQARNYGLDVNGTGLVRPLSVFIKLAAERGEDEMVRLLVLHEANQRAIYSDQALPHYNLNFERYTHFTSPIRRYVDLCVHRLLKQYSRDAHGNAMSNPAKSVATWCSQRSEAADRAQMEFDSWKKLQLLECERGGTFRACVQRVTDSGFFANVENYGVSVFVPVAVNATERPGFSRDGFGILNEITGDRWDVGSQVSIRLLGMDWARRRPIVELEWSGKVKNAA